MYLTLEEIIQILNDLADYNECDGDCNRPPDYQRCKFCQARQTLNEVGEIVRMGLQSILQSKTWGGKQI